MSYLSSVPSDWVNVPEFPLERLIFSDLYSFSFDRPIIIPDFPSHAFPSIPHAESDLIPFLLNVYGSHLVPVVGVDGTLDEPLNVWYKNKQGRYLKDWHINKTRPLFTTPLIFPDWLNGYYIASKRSRPTLDFQFLYWGDTGTATGYHEDVVGSFSWSFNLRGKKLWKFFVSNENGRNVFNLEQTRGEMVFVPSGCFHTVENLEDDTISINQNWFNEWNIFNVCKKLISDTVNVKGELNDFGIQFECESEQVDRIELIVYSNNSLNIGILLEIIEWRISQGHLSPRCRNGITSALNLIADKRLPQFQKYERVIERARAALVKRRAMMEYCKANSTRF